MNTSPTPRAVIHELRAADPMDTPPGAHVHFPEVSWPEPAPPHPGALPNRYLRRRTNEFASMHGHATSLPIGMIEPVDATAALASLAEAEALAATVPRRPTLLRRFVPTTATAFWMAVSGWLGFLLARAEGWL